MSTSKRIKNIEEYKKMYDKMVRYQAVKEPIYKIPMVYNLENYKLDQIDNEKEEIISSIGKVKMEVKKDKTAEIEPNPQDNFTIENKNERITDKQESNIEESTSKTNAKKKSSRRDR
ncbi:hypothetical protein LCGC14_1558770 [marine sediment metagenome]|uniref:Uncharacterized protein n=1 Tax=marine sediment metagenome TaxID=412755 RepID=A0A0F9LP16_9ZZZZ